MNILHVIFTIYACLIFGIQTIVLTPLVVIPFMLGTRASWISYNVLWFWAWSFSKLCFIRCKLHGQENFKNETSYIIVSNHTSFLDLIGLRLLIPGEFRPIAKKELLKIPIFGLVVRTATIVVDRSNATSRKRSIERMKKILTKGISALIFAEGTQNRTKEILQPFKDGAFRMATDLQMPIIPVVVVGAGKLMPPGKFSIKPGTIDFYALKPIDTVNLTNEDIASLKEKTFNIMYSMLSEKIGKTN